METVAEITAARKVSKAFYAHLYEQEGAITKVNGIIYFVADDGDIVEVEPSMVNFLTVLGEMQTADAQRIDDLMHGGYAAVACNQEMGVQ